MTFTELERLAVVETDIKHLTKRHEEFRVESREKHEEFRDEVRGEFHSVRVDVASVRADVAEIKQLLTQAKGGWLALSGGWRAAMFTGGALSLVATYAWDWLAPLLRALPR